MKPSKYRAALNDYSMLMEEAKYRLLAMDIVLGGGTGLPKGAIREFCFLELRMLCELIALGCLTAHGDLKTSKLKQVYEADRIIRRLQKLHPDFFSVGATPGKAGPVLRKDGFLTKKDLVKLYWRCGDALHRGSFQALYHGDIRILILKKLELGSKGSKLCLTIMRSSWLTKE